MVVARAMADRAYADQLRDACMGVALELGGWTNARKLKNGDLKRMQRVRAAAS
jgi:TetR/AcrR family transcriptional repressor of nem operon